MSIVFKSFSSVESNGAGSDMIKSINSFAFLGDVCFIHIVKKIMTSKVVFYKNDTVLQTVNVVTAQTFGSVIKNALGMCAKTMHESTSLKNIQAEIVCSKTGVVQSVSLSDDVETRPHTEIRVQTALCKKMLFKVSKPKTDNVLAQVTSKLASSLSTLDNLQQLLAAPKPFDFAVIYMQFKAAKRMSIVQDAVSFYYEHVTVERATTKSAADVLKMPYCISHNLSDGERDHIQAALDGTLPLCDELDTAVVLSERDQFVMQAGHALTGYDCKACGVLHNTPCLSCIKKPVCNFDRVSKKKFEAWSMSDDAFICVGCGHTVCEVCKTFFKHSCQSLPRVFKEYNYKFQATIALHFFKIGADPFKIEYPEIFLKSNLPDCGIDGLQLRQVRIAFNAMTSFAKFRAEAQHILREPGQWTIGLDSTNDSQLFVALFGIDKRYVKLRDVAKERFASKGVDNFKKTAFDSLHARKPPYGNLIL